LSKQNVETKKTLDHLKQTLSLTKNENSGLAQKQKSSMSNVRGASRGQA